MQAVKNCHPLITDQFNTGAGLRLMGYDSEIAANVLQHFTDKGILCLCMHDSFIVQKQYEEELIDVMKESYKNKFPFNCQIK